MPHSQQHFERFIKDKKDFIPYFSIMDEFGGPKSKQEDKDRRRGYEAKSAISFWGCERNFIRGVLPN